MTSERPQPEAQEHTPSPTHPGTSPQARMPDTSSQHPVASAPPPVTRKHIVGISALAVSLCILILIPGILADYYTAKYLKPRRLGKDHANTHRWDDLTRRKGIPIPFRGKEDMLLQGWFFRPDRPHQRLVFYLHDFGRDHRDGYDIVRDLLKHGFHVFAFDMRAHGESQGKVGRSLRYNSEDIRMALNYLTRLLPNLWHEPVAIVGEGMGGSVALLTATQDGRFRHVVALEPSLDPETQITQMLRGKPSFLVSLTQQRIERVGEFYYRQNSPHKNAQRLRDSTVLLWAKKTPETQKEYTDFCKQTRGSCRVDWLQQNLPPFWWNALSIHQRDQIVQFLLQQFRIPVKHYRFRLRPNPPVLQKKSTRHIVPTTPRIPSVVLPKSPIMLKQPPTMLKQPPVMLKQPPRMLRNHLLPKTRLVVPSSLPAQRKSK